MKNVAIRGIALLCLLFSSQLIAGYNVNVAKVKDWSEASGKIAIAPAICPADFDCVWLNETMADYVGAEGYPFTAGPMEVSQGMLEAGVETLDGDSARLVADILGVDSFLIVMVGNSETRANSAVAVPVYGGGFIVAPNNRAQGGVEIRVISSGGKSLARGSGFGESGFRKGRGVIGKVFDSLIDELLFNDSE